MKYTIAALMLMMPQPQPAQRRGAPILPDGVTVSKEEHRIDLSTCDTVHIAGPVRELTVRDGQFDIYWFRRYSDVARITMKCEVEVRK